MTDDEIMDMAREAGFTWEPINNIIGPLRRLTFLVAARAAAEEREACADAAREWEDAYVIEDSAPRHVDDAIRARADHEGAK
jgi:hypothetical protein